MDNIYYYKEDSHLYIVNKSFNTNWYSLGSMNSFKSNTENYSLNKVIIESLNSTNSNITTTTNTNNNNSNNNNNNNNNTLT
jgi:hypothetical protein